MSIVSTHQLTKLYRSGFVRRSSVTALKDATIDVGAGEIFGLLGPNGAGKTTFVKILLSITFPSAGTAEVFGKPLGDLSIREHSGYLPESHRYPPFLTARETLMLFGSMHGVPSATLRARAETLLALVGLKDWKNVKVRKFSKGMLQRLGLAQALLGDPELLFLDEPTDGVDPIGRKEIRDLLRQLRNEGRAIFLNSHLLSEVEIICDRVAILNHGEVLRVGTVESITDKKLEYEFQTETPLSPELLGRIASLVESLTPEGRSFTVRANNKETMNGIVDLLRAQGILISSITQKKSTLEESFIKLIKEETGS
jgi:ABC-2 type transport system ATP-binding protein